MTVGRIPSVEGGIQPTIFDAKGNLLTATANDTPAVITVGADETRLVAASGETTGLKYVADTTNYAVGAKGDLLAGTAADTVAALAVGANNLVLTADSVETTGLKWTGGWVSYTPSWTATTTNPVIGNGSITGGFRRFGDIVEFYARIVAGSTTTYGTGTYRVSLPATAFASEYVQGFTVGLLDNGVAWYTNYYGQGQASGLNASFETYGFSGGIWTPTAPFTFGNTDSFTVQGRYRAL